MPRRSSKRAETDVLDVSSTDIITTPRKGRRAVKIETTEVVTKIEQISPSRLTSVAKAEADSDDESLVTANKSPPKRKINRVKAKAIDDEEQNTKQKKPAAKRKAKTEVDDDDDGGERKAPKKRKSKEEKEAEAMPLAARTLVKSLKKLMHIGAHVSGAGGKPCKIVTLPSLGHECLYYQRGV